MKRFVLILALVLLAAQPTLAQETFSFQGRLTTPDGTPVADGSYGIQFQLFEAPTGGSPRWAESHSLTTSGGVFSVVLGTKATLKLEAFEDTPQLQLIVDGAALSPRTLLTSVPYAMKSYRLDEAALVPGQNVSITRLTDGTLQIGSTGGGGGTGGLTSVATDATMAGNGTSLSPLGLADGSVTGVKLANNALLAGANVDIVRRGNGSWEISSTGSGGGGLTQVASDATLSGDGTAGSPLRVSAPLVLTSAGTEGTVRGHHSSGNVGFLGGSVGAYGGHSNGNFGVLGAIAYAGYFQGDVHVTGTLSKGGGAFKIDHPLDPANKYLSHSFVESPDMKNVYDGNVTTDENGEAIVTLPDYFEALNRDFRYQLTVIGQFAQAIVEEEIQGNRFVIRTDQPHVKVSWQVTGIRQDAWANEHRIVVEEDKPTEEQGFYLHPRLFGQPQERGLMRALAPERPRTDQQIEADRPLPQQ